MIVYALAADRHDDPAAAGALRRARGVGARAPQEERRLERAATDPRRRDASRSRSAGSRRSPTSRWRSRRGRSTGSSARTAPARRPSSTCSPASTSRDAATIRLGGRDVERAQALPDRRARAWRARSRTSASSASCRCSTTCASPATCARRRRCAAAILRTPRHVGEEHAIAERAQRSARHLRARRPAPTSRRATCPTATSAAWRSRARSPPTPRSSSSTSRPPA